MGRAINSSLSMSLPERVEVRRSPLKAFLYGILVVPFAGLLPVILLIALMIGWLDFPVWPSLLFALGVGAAMAIVVWSMLMRPLLHPGAAVVLHKDGLEVPLHIPGTIYPWANVRLVPRFGFGQPLTVMIVDMDPLDFAPKGIAGHYFRALQRLFNRKKTRMANLILLPVYSPGLRETKRLIGQYIEAAKVQQSLSGEAPEPSGQKFMSQKDVNRMAYSGLFLGILLVVGFQLWMGSNEPEAQDEAVAKADVPVAEENETSPTVAATGAKQDADAALRIDPVADERATARLSDHDATVAPGSDGLPSEGCAMRATNEVYPGGRTVIARFCDWGVTVQRMDDDNQLCYIFSYPTVSEDERRGRRPNFFVTTWPNRGQYRAPGALSRFVKYETKMSVTVGASVFALRVNDEDGYFQGARAEQAFFEAAGKYETLTVTEVTPIGSETIDTYSLYGFAEAYGAMERLCAERG